MCREKKIGRMYIYDQHLSICIPAPKFFFFYLQEQPVASIKKHAS